jgi:hypothetical protein
MRVRIGRTLVWVAGIALAAGVGLFLAPSVLVEVVPLPRLADWFAGGDSLCTLKGKSYTATKIGDWTFPWARNLFFVSFMSVVVAGRLLHRPKAAPAPTVG